MNQISNADKRITDVIGQSSFTISAEVIPPRNGAEQEKILGQIDSLASAGAEFFSVTKGAGGSLRGGSLPIAHVIKDQFKVPVIAHFTCRDLTPQEVENQMMDHHYFGVRNVLALRGDPPQDQPEWNPHDNSYPYAYMLIEQIKKLNGGEYLKRPTGQQTASSTKTDFSIGAAVYPEHPDEKERLEFFKLKVEAGAEYAISQMLFDSDAYGRFLDLMEKNGLDIPILPGTRILKSQAQARRMASRFEVGISDEIMKALPEEPEENGEDRLMEIFFKYIERLKSLGAPGVHLFVLSDTKPCSQLIRLING